MNTVKRNWGVIWGSLVVAGIVFASFGTFNGNWPAGGIVGGLFLLACLWWGRER